MFGSPILLAPVVPAASSQVLVNGLPSFNDGLFGHDRTEHVSFSVGMPAVLIRSYWSDLRPELFRAWGGRVEPATTTNFDLQTNLARVGPSGSGLLRGCWEDMRGWRQL